MVELAVTDTHSLLWYATGVIRRLGREARGDRLIAASAVHLGAPLITRDQEIANTAGVTTIW